MSYQAVVRDAGNNLVSSTDVGMQISILQGSSSGTAVYVETQAPTSNTNGLVSLEIGTGTQVSGDFTTIDWANDTYFIKTETDPTGGTTYTITGTTQLMSVPYALHAKTAENITGTVTYTETDPIFGASVANGIIAIDTANWNNHTVDTDTQIDSTGIVTLGFVAGAHTVNTDAQTLTVSQTGDTLTINGGNSVLVPGISDLNFPPAIGDFRDGGVVFWVDGTGGGLVVSVVDQSTAAEWGCYGTEITGADGTAIGTGAQNTIDIETGCATAGTAADICANLTLNTYSDWFLPSIEELQEIYNYRVAINATAVNNSGTSLGTDNYFSSTETSSNIAWYYTFGNGYPTNGSKNFTFRVRAVRAF